MVAWSEAKHWGRAVLEPQWDSFTANIKWSHPSRSFYNLFLPSIQLGFAVCLFVVYIFKMKASHRCFCSVSEPRATVQDELENASAWLPAAPETCGNCLLWQLDYLESLLWVYPRSSEVLRVEALAGPVETFNWTSFQRWDSREWAHQDQVLPFFCHYLKKEKDLRRICCIKDYLIFLCY